MTAHPPWPPPPPVPPGPGRLRPRARWFAVWGAVLAVAVLLLVVTVVRSVAGFTDTDATIRAGAATTLDVDAGAGYLVWQRPGRGDACVVTDAATGDDVATERLGSTSYSRSSNGSSWEGDRTFEAPSDRVEIRCADRGGPVQVGREPRVLGVVDGVVGAVVVPVLLGLLGFVMLLVVTILFATGARRPRAGA